MSRLAKKPIVIENGVKVQINPSSVVLEGTKGKQEVQYMSQYISLRLEENELWVDSKGSSKPFRAYQGLYFSLIKNALIGVDKGFEKQLVLKGVGYKWELKGKTLVLNVGFSHPIEFSIPEGVHIVLESPTALKVAGVDKQIVGQVAANIRFVRPPEPYKGKGVRYFDEVIKLKEGKSGK